MTDLLDRPRSGGRDREGQPAGRVSGERPRIDPRIAQRWVETRRQEGRRRLRILVVVASLVSLAGLVVGSLYTPLFALRHLRITTTGASVVGTARIEAEGGLAHRPLLMDVNPAAVARRLDADPLLGAAHVTKHWPSTVTVSVAERVPLAQVPAGAGSGGSSSYVPVDETGRVLGQPAPRIPGLPVLQGAGPVPAPGGWIPGSPGPGAVPGSAAAALVNMDAASDAPDLPRRAAVALSVLQALPAGVRAAVQSVDIGAGGVVSLVVAPPRLATATITMTLGDGSQLAAKVTALETLLAQASLSGVSSVDLSVPTRPAAILSGSGPGASGSGSATSGSGSATSGSGSGSAASGSASGAAPSGSAASSSGSAANSSASG